MRAATWKIFRHAGVPVLALSQDANRYFDYHHSADDTLAIVRRGELNQNVAALGRDLGYGGGQRSEFPPLPSKPHHSAIGVTITS